MSNQRPEEATKEYAALGRSHGMEIAQEVAEVLADEPPPHKAFETAYLMGFFGAICGGMLAMLGNEVMQQVFDSAKRQCEAMNKATEAKPN